MRRRRVVTGSQRRQAHIEWLKLIEVTGPFLSVPILTAEWPDLEPLDPADRDKLRLAHRVWQDDPGAGRDAWISFVLRDLLGWGGALRFDPSVTLDIPEHETTLSPTLTLDDPETGEPVLLGLVSSGSPVARVAGSDWPATPADRLALLLRSTGVELGLATDGRWWALVWAPAGGVTTVAVFDSVSWNDAAERLVVRSFLSLLQRRRFFGVPVERRLPALLRESLKHQEDITDALGVQVRQAVEMLVAAFARSSLPSSVTAQQAYRGAVAVMMRLVFLLFAEESGLLPADNALYASSYSVGGLYSALEDRVADAGGNEGELEHTYLAWHRLLALFNVVYHGVTHPELSLIAYDGSLFDPGPVSWFPLTVDDRTVLHMLRSVQTVLLSGERRTVSFRTLTVEQIGYVYEGLLSFEGFRAIDVVVGLIGKPGREEEVSLASLEALGPSPDALAAAYKDSGIGSERALTGRLTPLAGEDRAQAESRLYAVTQDHGLVQRLLPYYGIIRRDLRDDPVVILPGQLYVTESSLRSLHRHPLHTALPGRAGRRGCLGAVGLLTGAIADRGPLVVETPVFCWNPLVARRRHRDGLRRVPRRRLPLPSRQAHRGLGRIRQRRRRRPRLRPADRVRPGTRLRRRSGGRRGETPDHRALSVWRGHQLHGGGDGQALAVARLHGPITPVHLPGRQASLWRFPARHHVGRATRMDAPVAALGPRAARGFGLRLDIRCPFCPR